jgi:hypothetical protein
MRTVGIVCAVAIWAAATGSAGAAGAIAFGSTGDVAKDGYSIGIATNYDAESEARDGAMKHCTTHGGEQSKKACEIVVVFAHQCAAEAEDPKTGTPGFGFAVANTKEDAESIAMAICLASSGKGRRQFCKVTTTACDTK